MPLETVVLLNTFTLYPIADEYKAEAKRNSNVLSSTQSAFLKTDLQESFDWTPNTIRQYYKLYKTYRSDAERDKFLFKKIGYDRIKLAAETCGKTNGLKMDILNLEPHVTNYVFNLNTLRGFFCEFINYGNNYLENK